MILFYLVRKDKHNLESTEQVAIVFANVGFVQVTREIKSFAILNASLSKQIAIILWNCAYKNSYVCNSSYSHFNTVTICVCIQCVCTLIMLSVHTVDVCMRKNKKIFVYYFESSSATFLTF